MPEPISMAMAAGAAAQGLGALASSFGGQRDSRKRRYKYTQTELQARHDWALRNKISPLVALGVQPSSIPPTNVSPFPEALERAGAAVKGGMEAMQASKMARQTFNESKARENMYKTQSGLDFARQMEVWSNISRAAQAPKRPKLWIEVIDDAGNVRKIVNPDLAEAFQEGAGFLSSQKAGSTTFQKEYERVPRTRPRYRYGKGGITRHSPKDLPPRYLQR